MLLLLCCAVPCTGSGAGYGAGGGGDAHRWVGGWWTYDTVGGDTVWVRDGAFLLLIL